MLENEIIRENVYSRPRLGNSRTAEILETWKMS